MKNLDEALVAFHDTVAEWGFPVIAQAAAAEQMYRAALALSSGSVDARMGLGWTLVQLDHCDEAIAVLREVLASQPSEVRAQSGVQTCLERHRLHGALWLTLDGALYQDHPWKHSLGDALVGVSVQSYRGLSLGGAYRFLHLSPTDDSIANVTQHEVYANAGYASPAVDVLARGAWLWSTDGIANGSAHMGLSTRVRLTSEVIDEMASEATVSHYRDA